MTQLTQYELFDKTLEEKIFTMQRWLSRLEKQLYFLKTVHDLRMNQKREVEAKPMEQQMEMFL